MIRCAQHTDVPCLKSLWKVCFNDTPLYIDRFFDTCFTPESTWVHESCSSITSVVYLLSGFVLRKEKAVLLHYIYGCATDPTVRGQGQMGALLDRALRYSIDRGVFAQLLITGDDGLIGFYSRHGFVSLPPLRFRAFTNVPRAGSEAKVIRLTSSLLSESREELYAGKGIVGWTDAHYGLLLNDVSDSNGKALRVKTTNADGYLMCYPMSNGAKVIEWGVNDLARFDEWITDAIGLLPAGRILVTEMPGVRFPEGIERNRGMIRYCQNDQSVLSGESLFLNLGLSD